MAFLFFDHGFGDAEYRLWKLAPERNIKVK